MNDLEQARELASAAERDISALRGMDDAAIFADEIFGFHVQQAAEKLFKAWLALQGET
jgi:HEPN domain-containing protein